MMLAIFGDVHGNLPAMYDYVQRWESSYAQPIHAILQAGDMGLFPDVSRLDKATRDHARDDKTELMASPYIHGQKEATHDTYFVHGNHEDFRFVNQHKSKPIDPPGRIQHIHAPNILTLEHDDHTVTIAGLGGIQPPATLDDKARAQLGKKYYDPQDVNALLRNADEVDIFLTHDGFLHHDPETDHLHGPSVVHKLIQRLEPRYHFYGHHGDPPNPFELGTTKVYPLNQPDVLRLPGRDGGMGILDTQSWEFTFVYKGEI